MSEAAENTLVTRAALQDAIKNLREILEADIRGLETRLSAIDKATELFTENLSRVPTDTDKQVGHLKELHDERINSTERAISNLAEGIQKQFDERDIRSRASEQSAETAVNAALQAQKEAAGKSEVSTVKQIDGLGALMASSNEAMNDKISAINSRLDRGDGKSTGVTATTATMLAVGALAVSVLGVGAAFIGSKHDVPVAVVAPLQPK